ncbi:MAG: 3-hydroxyacyl-ACP dehydratase [Bacteroidetes bacterium]|nr:MAG: 3-hydroxyacyl-ACP dehydratase [Bacteroidota bacterium]
MKLYKILSIEKLEEATRIVVSLNNEHEVYQGHFPGMPILPGVLQVEMLKELFEGILGKLLRLDSAKSIKHLNMIDPNTIKEVVFELKYKVQEGGWNLRATISDLKDDKPKIFMKFSGVFTEV